MPILSAEQKNALGRALTLAIVGLIMISGVYVIVYINNKKQTTVANANNDAKVDAPTIVPTVPLIPDLSGKTVRIFIDANNNGKRDNGETNCDECLGKYLVSAKISEADVLPESSELKEVLIGGGGEVNTSFLNDTNSVWGFFADREVLILPSKLTNSSESEIFLPAVTTSLNISAVNAGLTDVKRIQTDDNTQMVNYTFNNLIPALKRAYDDKKTIWVYLEPDAANLSKAYLVKGKIAYDKNGDITNSKESYYIQIKWQFDGPVPEVFDASKVSFIL